MPISYIFLVAMSLVPLLIGLSVEEAHQNFECDTFLAPLLKSQEFCRSQSEHVVDACVVFSYDYEYVMPFLLHHLNIGFRKIRIYNNDGAVSWFNHPAITCLVAAKLVTIQPWYGVGVMVKGINHCQKIIHHHSKKLPKSNVWMAPFDIDEYVVMHKETCINTLVSTRKAPGMRS